MAAAPGIVTTAAPPNAVVQIQGGMNVQPVVLVDQNGQYLATSGSAATAGYLADATGTVHVANATAPTAGQVLTATGASAATWQGVSGQYLCVPTQYAPASPATLSTTSATMAAVSSSNVNTGSFTAPPSGDVMVTAGFVFNNSGSGVASGFGLAAHGTVSPLLSNVITYANNIERWWTSLQFLVTGLTAGTSYNLDLLFATAGAGSDTLSIYALGSTSTTPTGAVQGPVLMTVQAV